MSRMFSASRLPSTSAADSTLAQPDVWHGPQAVEWNHRFALQLQRNVSQPILHLQQITWRSDSGAGDISDMMGYSSLLSPRVPPHCIGLMSCPCPFHTITWKYFCKLWYIVDASVGGRHSEITKQSADVTFCIKMRWRSWFSDRWCFCQTVSPLHYTRLQQFALRFTVTWENWCYL